MTLTVAQMAEKMGISNTASAQPYIQKLSDLENLRIHSPQAFNELHDALSKYPANKNMSQQEVEAISADIIKKYLITAHNFNAAHGACQALSGLGTLVRSKTLVNACKITEQSLTFTENIKKINAFINMPNISLETLISGGTVTMLCSAASMAFSLFGDFNESPSIQQIMLEQLQGISEQIHTLRQELHEGLVGIHEHLDSVQEQIFKSNLRIISEMTEQFSGIRNQLDQNFESLWNYLEQSFKNIAAGQRHIALQNLREIVSSIDIGNADKPLAEIVNLEHNLVQNWLLTEIRSVMFNGSGLFEKNNTHASHESDIKVLAREDATDLGNILGYVAHIAAEMDPNHSRSFNPNDVANPYIFEYAVSKLIELYKKYPAQLEEQEQDLTAISEACLESLNLFENIMHSDELFTKLFANYIQATEAIGAAIELQTAKTNSLFHQEHPLAKAFDLSDDLNTMLDKFKAGPVSKPVAASTQATLNSIATRNDYPSFIISKNVNVPPLNLNEMELDRLPFGGTVVLGSYMDLCEIESTYAFACNVSGHVFGSDLLAQGLNLDINSATKDRMIYEITSEISFKFIDFKYTNRSSTVITHDYNESPHLLRSMLNTHPKYPHGFHSYCSSTEHDILSGRAPNHPQLHNLKIEAFQGFVLNPLSSKLKLQKFNTGDLIYGGMYPNGKHYTDLLNTHLTDKILNMRKNKVIAPLVANSSSLPEFKQALDYLDSARYRLIAFCKMANLHTNLIDAVKRLPDSKSIREQLNIFFRTATTLEEKMWSAPDTTNINRLRDEILASLLLMRQHRLHVPNIAEQSLQQAHQELQECQNLFLPTYRASKPGRTNLQATKLGFNLTKLDEQTKNANNSIRLRYLTLKNVIEKNRNLVTQYVDDYLDIPKIEWYIDYDRRITPLHVAAYFGNEEIILTMRRLFASLINKQDNLGKTPLMYAIEANNEIGVRTLIQNGADLTIPNFEEKNAFELAIDCPNQQIRNLLQSLAPQANLPSNRF